MTRYLGYILFILFSFILFHLGPCDYIAYLKRTRERWRRWVEAKERRGEERRGQEEKKGRKRGKGRKKRESKLNSVRR